MYIGAARVHMHIASGRDVRSKASIRRRVIRPVLSRELVSRRLSALRWLARNAATPTYYARVRARARSREYQ